MAKGIALDVIVPILDLGNWMLRSLSTCVDVSSLQQNKSEYSRPIRSPCFWCSWHPLATKEMLNARYVSTLSLCSRPIPICVMAYVLVITRADTNPHPCSLSHSHDYTQYGLKGTTYKGHYLALDKLKGKFRDSPYIIWEIFWDTSRPISTLSFINHTV